MATSAKPQCVVTGTRKVDVWPEQWGLTVGQFRELLQECQQEETWTSDTTVYTLVDKYVKPKTRGSGLGYALLKNRDSPKEVNVMVSHAWAENAEEFLSALERSVEETDVMFICALSLYQCEDGCGPSLADQLGSRPSDSPFKRVLKHISDCGSMEGWQWRYQRLLAEAPGICTTAALTAFFFIVGSDSCIPTWVGSCAVGVDEWEDLSKTDHLFWAVGCLVPRWNFVYKELSRSSKVVLLLALSLFIAAGLLYLREIRWPGYRGRMVAVPNRECDLYTRLWCVYEICVATVMGVPVELARTLASAGKCASEKASCRSEADMLMIFNDMADRRGSLPNTDARSFARRKLSTTSNRDAESSEENATGSVELSIRQAEVEETCTKLDSAILRVTRQAHWHGILYLMKWIVPYLSIRLSMSLASFAEHGDFELAPLFNSRICTGILSHVIALVLFGSAVEATVIHARGRPSTRALLVVSIAFISLGVLTRVIDYSLGGSRAEMMDRPHPIHHCTGIEIGYCGVSLLCCVIAARCFPTVFDYEKQKITTVLFALVAFVILAVATVNGVGAVNMAADQYFPVAVWYASFRVFPCVAPFLFVWVSAILWGVRIHDGEECSKHVHSSSRAIDKRSRKISGEQCKTEQTV